MMYVGPSVFERSTIGENGIYKKPLISQNNTAASIYILGVSMFPDLTDKT